jgi:hypothetical protein
MARLVGPQLHPARESTGLLLHLSGNPASVHHPAVFPITSKLLAVVSDQVDYHFTDEPAPPGIYHSINNRMDNIAGLSLNWQIVPNLYLQPNYRFVFTNYRYNTLQNSDRTDYLNAVGTTLVYYFSQNISVRTFFNYSAKCSSDPYVAAYHGTDGGLGVSVNILF